MPPRTALPMISRDGRGGGGNEEPPRLGENLDGLREKAVQLAVDRFGQALEGGYGVVVVRGKAAADVEQLEIEAARLGLGEDAGGQVQSLAVVLYVGALATDVEAQPLDFELVVVSEGDQVYGLAGQGAELARQLHHRPGVGHAQPQHQARVRRVAGDLEHLVMVVVGDQRLVWIQLLERLDWP